ncbi:hypothetical protein B9Q12_00955 [Candidatus Marsarchaeota G2 archaeon ECH_B_SAG-G06]|uniref:Uncharacterized protein n=1 Tax=Candidatus Marsarchaeota G2 archaeon ECH_B_SAG-G06 TaxID=1978166 RepID=A0A2R6C2Q4_9ARCH|nr:MAG: hypothetical protein B9Q12_00955 [Candidatus Marsarchaeota G2 archaeon ECH_B_SAG-G06]
MIPKTTCTVRFEKLMLKKLYKKSKTLNLLDVVMVTHATRLLSSTLLNPLSSLALNAYAYVPHFARVRAEFFEHLEKAVLGVEAPITTLLAICRQISEKVSR